MEEKEIDLRDYLRVICQRKKMIGSIFILAVLVSGIISLLLPKTYSAEALVKIGKVTSIGFGKAGEYAGVFRSSEDVDNLQEASYVLKGDSSIMGLRERLKLSEKELPIGYKKNQIISITPLEETSSIRISCLTKRPALAKDMADALAGQFMARQKIIIERKKETFEQAQNMFKGQFTFNIEPSEILSSAAIPEYHLKPKIGLNILVAGITSLMVGILAAFILEYREKGKKDE
ncbi:hypothetical protein KKH56_00250 [bacterium]|nr:hypothetical protein [bacterium]